MSIAEDIKDKNYFFSTRWTLVEFLKQKNAMNDFKDDGSKWINYTTQNCVEESEPLKYTTGGFETL